MAKKSEGRLLSPSTASQSGIDLCRTEQRGHLWRRASPEKTPRFHLSWPHRAGDAHYSHTELEKHYPGHTVLGTMAAQSRDTATLGDYHELLNQERTRGLAQLQTTFKSEGVCYQK